MYKTLILRPLKILCGIFNEKYAHSRTHFVQYRTEIEKCYAPMELLILSFRLIATDISSLRDSSCFRNLGYPNKKRKALFMSKFIFFHIEHSTFYIYHRTLPGDVLCEMFYVLRAMFLGNP